MIDIHCHILPGIDDGSPNLEESLEMAKAAVAEGIHTIIATPHHENGRFTNEAAKVKRAVTAFNEVLEQQHIPLRVLPGQEIRIYRNFIDDYHSGQLVSLNDSPYILVEFPAAEIPKGIFELFHEMSILGKIPVIAHPERNQELVRHPERLVELIELGALSQVTSHSLNGLFGRKIQEAAFQFCKWNLVHFVASDAHNMRQRSFSMKRAFDALDSEIGVEYSKYYHSNSEALVQLSPINPKSVTYKKRKRLLFWK